MIDPKELAVLPRDTKREQKVAAELRALNEKHRWVYIKSALNADRSSNLPNALVLAPKISLDRSHLIELLEISLGRANPSSINSYLKAVLPGLGYKRVVHFFEQCLATNPEQVGMALYYLPRQVQTPSDEEQQTIRNLAAAFCNHVAALDIKSAYLESCYQYNTRNT